MTTRNGTPGNDTLTGTSGDDSLYGFAGADRLFGDGGDDLLVGGTGNDLIDGGSGSDTASYADASAGVSVNLSLSGPQATGDTGTDTLISIENIIGSAFADRLAGDGGDNILDGGAGLDTVSYAGATAGITIDLARSGVQATGGAGNDTLLNFENVTGSAFDDLLSGTAGNNVFTAGAGIDTLSYANAWSGVTVNLAVTFQQDTIGAGRDTLFGIENLVGSGFADAITGSDGDNSLDGGGGIDRISYGNATAAVTVSLALQGMAQATGGSGIDTLRNFENLTGSGFDDLLAGDAGNNIIAGGTGIDTVSYAAASAAVIVDLALTMAQDTIGAGRDTLVNIENIIGSAFDDELFDTDGNNVLHAGDGDDRVQTIGGSDSVDGGAGFDEWQGFYQSTTTSLSGSYTGSTGILAMSNGTTVQNFEILELQTGSGDDDFTITVDDDGMPDGRLSFNGSDGNDALLIDLAGRTTSSIVEFSTFGQPQLVGEIDIGPSLLGFGDFENVELRLGVANDTVLVNSLPTLGTIKVDAAAGIDTLKVDLTDLPDGTYSFSVGGPVTLAAATFRGFENFVIDLGAGNTNVTTGDGNDKFIFWRAQAVIDGGAGYDSIDILGQSAGFQVIADGSGGAFLSAIDPVDGPAGSVRFANIEQLVFFDTQITSLAQTGGAQADAVAGTSLLDTLSGFGGDDILTGFGGDDALFGGDGNDTAVFGGNRADYTLTAVTPAHVMVQDNLAGRDGTDALTDIEFLRFADGTIRARSLAFVSPAAFTIAENSLAVGSVVAVDADFPLVAIRYAIAGGADAARFTIDAATGALAFAAAPDFEAPGDAGGDNVYDLVITADNGTADAQAITVTVTNLAEGPTQGYTGTSAANVFAVTGTEGWTLAGLGGADTLTGGTGTDVIIGGKGNDRLAGGDGNDTFHFATGDGIDAIDGGAGFDRLLATGANAVIAVSALAGIEVIDAGGFAGVRLAGTAAANIIDLSTTVLTGIGSISGLGGNDSIIGSTGDDRIIGGAGADTLAGGAGNDIFAYTVAADSLVGTARADRIVDFTSGADIIDLGGIDADATLAGNQAFAFIGDAAFTGVGQLRVGTDSAGNIALFGNISGSIAADFQISLYGAPAIGVADLLL